MISTDPLRSFSTTHRFSPPVVDVGNGSSGRRGFRCGLSRARRRLGCGGTGSLVGRRSNPANGAITSLPDHLLLTGLADRGSSSDPEFTSLSVRQRSSVKVGGISVGRLGHSLGEVLVVVLSATTVN